MIDRLCFEPDCVIYIDGTIETMKQRLAGKKKDVIENLGDDYFSSVLETYQDLIQERDWYGHRLLTLDAETAVDKKVQLAINYMKEVYRNVQLENGTIEMAPV